MSVMEYVSIKLLLFDAIQPYTELQVCCLFYFSLALSYTIHKSTAVGHKYLNFPIPSVILSYRTQFRDFARDCPV